MKNTNFKNNTENHKSIGRPWEFKKQIRRLVMG